ncbi:MAG TPA: uroporphyrinogen-III C-methyltransferase [Gammaproteobacteria bacterium]|nr:uroporphyrinogen-III C-methyltransferase [Gammaproteobacteria bacterium]
MEYLPIFLAVQKKHCLVVGGGEVAARKTDMLKRAGAAVTVVAPELVTSLSDLHDRGEIQYVAARFSTEQLDGMTVVIAATDDDTVNRQVAEAAASRNIPVNVVDRPALCSFVFPSIIDRSPIVVAISSAGASPVLARHLRAKLETIIPASYGKLAELARRFREKVKNKFRTTDDRRRFWEKVLEGPIAEFVYTGREKQAEDTLQQVLDSETAEPGQGEVYLVGGGPGDPDLLTFRALRLMQQADVVVYDRLVSKEVLELVRRDAEKFYVGKERDNHAVPQEGINEMLVRLAKEGKRVLRLKGGDPFIFGRGGEEIETLAAEGVPFQVVPGITAAAGCASYSGIPLTHRDYSQSVVFVTGHLKDGTVDLNWKALSQPNQTIVFYMGLHGIPDICKGLIGHGMPATTPVALVQQGTTQRQRVYIGTLDSLPELVQRESIKPPTLIIVGEVVRLHDKLNWFNPQS